MQCSSESPYRSIDTCAGHSRAQGARYGNDAVHGTGKTYSGNSSAVAQDKTGIAFSFRRSRLNEMSRNVRETVNSDSAESLPYGHALASSVKPGSNAANQIPAVKTKPSFVCLLLLLEAIRDCLLGRDRALRHDIAPWDDGIELVSATPDWISIIARCDKQTAERLIQFFREMTDLPDRKGKMSQPLFAKC